MQQLVGDIFIAIGIIFMVLGVIGIYKFNDFYARLLASSKVDTVGALTILIGVVIRHGFTYFSGKVAILIVIMLIFNPLVSHVLARSAYLSGKREEK